MRKKSILILKILCLILFTIFLSLLSQPALAEIKAFVKEYTYRAGDEDSKNSSRVIALREVKRLLLEELGTYLASQTEVINFQMTKDQITTLTAGIVSTEIIEDTWNGKRYWLKAKITANPQEVIKSIDDLRKDLGKVKELEEIRKRSEELLQENKRLNKELRIAKGAKQKEAAKAYNDNINNLSAAEWVERGYVLGRSGNHADAVGAFSKAIELNPQFVEAYSSRGVTYGYLSNHQQAIADFNKVIELNPQIAYAYANRGVTYKMLGDYQLAIKDYSKAIELNPRDALFYSIRAAANDNLSNYQQAIKDYSKAIELNPMDVNGYFKRGVAYAYLGNQQQAINDYSKAIELNPQYANAYISRANAYSKLRNYQQTISDLISAARLGDENAQALLKDMSIEW